MARAPLPNELTIDPGHCGQPMRYRGGGIKWAGVVETTTGRWSCDNCGVRIEVVCTDFSPLPTGSEV
jgi:hypothetical protein